MKHSSYTYQKLFRALYGYTQIVNKATGKKYKYHRPGVLSSCPYIRSGKNCVIIPQDSLQTLIKFFKTGMNPAHHWRVKGDWKAVYYMDEKQINPKLVVNALEQLIERQFLDNKKPLLDELRRVVDSENVSADYIALLLSKLDTITKHHWFKAVSSESKKLKEIKEMQERLSLKK